MRRLLPIVALLALGGCAAEQDQVLKKMPNPQASERSNCSFQTVNRTVGSTTSMVCH